MQALRCAICVLLGKCTTRPVGGAVSAQQLTSRYTVILHHMLGGGGMRVAGRGASRAEVVHTTGDGVCERPTVRRSRHELQIAGVSGMEAASEPGLHQFRNRRSLRRSVQCDCNHRGTPGVHPKWTFRRQRASEHPATFTCSKHVACTMLHQLLQSTRAQRIKFSGASERK